MEQTVFIQNPTGLHARPAVKLAQRAGSFQCDISLVRKGKTVNAKSIMSVLALGVGPNEEVKVIAEGAQAAQALEAIVDILESVKD